MTSNFGPRSGWGVDDDTDEGETEMDTTTIDRIVRETTTVYRKGDPLYHNGESVETLPENPTGVIEYFGYPPTSDAPSGVIDMVFVDISVDPAKAEHERGNLVAAIGDGIGPEYGTNLADGPSYIHLGGELGNQEAALRFMALGKSLGLWEIVTPKTLGFDGDEAKQMAGMGLLYAVDWKKPA